MRESAKSFPHKRPARLVGSHWSGGESRNKLDTKSWAPSRLTCKPCKVGQAYEGVTYDSFYWRVNPSSVISSTASSSPRVVLASHL